MIDVAEPPADGIVRAIHSGRLAAVAGLLHENPAIAATRFGTKDPHGAAQTLLHVATCPPGHYPHRAETIAALAAAGADVNAACSGNYPETPLHWAASSNDIEALEALLDAGADMEAPGAVVDGGTPLADAVGFGQWQAARDLIDHGAHTTLRQAAAVGLRQRILDFFPDGAPPPQEEVNAAFWHACRGGQFVVAMYLHDHGADINWRPGWEDLTPLDAARHSHARDLVAWLRRHGAGSSTDSI
jgi:uncharacterized protein